MTVVDVKMSSGWETVFPFVEGFEAVVDGVVSLEYLRQLVCVLEPAIQVLSDMVEQGNITEASVRTLVFSVAALSRVRVVQAYAVEIEERCDRSSLLDCLMHEWELMIARDQLVFTTYTDVVGDMLSEGIAVLWASYAVREMCTAHVLADVFPLQVDSLRVVPLGNVLVQSVRGVLLNDALAEHGDKPVLPAEVYPRLLGLLRDLLLPDEVQKPPDELLSAVSVIDTTYGVLDADVVRAWLWLLIAGYSEMPGYCYQLVFPPGRRYYVCCVLSRNPVVREVLWLLESVDVNWARRLAVVRDSGPLHVIAGGRPDVAWLCERENKVIGMMQMPMRQEVDYYARAIVDEFLAAHKPPSAAVAVPPPLDAEFESLSVSVGSTAGREFIDVAHVLYNAVDEVVSPRAEHGDAIGAAYIVGDEHLSERDSAVAREVYERLCDGAVIYESYFLRTYRRFRRLHRRPRLDNSDGRLYHVFEGFPADGGGGTGPWEIDKNWGIPGWRSYVAEFDAGDARNVSFVADGGCQDIRMDCSGEGAIELGDCKVRVYGTVLWFTNSIRFRIVARESVCLRISVPDAGSAMAIGIELRRYMHIPGYAVAARSFDVVSGAADFTVPMERVRRHSVAGCQVYSGQRYIERGRHRFKLGQLSSLAPARVLVKTDPPEALQYISVCGMRLHPRSRDHVSMLIELRNTEMYVAVSTGVTMMVSLVQVVRIKEYELAVISTMEARMAVN